MLSLLRRHRLRAVVVAVAAAVSVLGVTVVAVAAEGDTVVGEVVQAWAEHADPAEAAAHAGDSLLTWIETDDGAAVRVPTADLAHEVGHASVGDTVSVQLGGEVRDGAAAGEGLDPARDVLDGEVVAKGTDGSSTAPASTPLTDEVTVVMMTPLGVAQDTRTLAEVVAAVNGPVADFWSEQSDGAIRIGVTAQFDWFQGTVDCSDPYALWDQAAAHAGWTRAPGRHLLVYLPYGAAGCSYGLGEVGSGLTAGGRAYVTDTATSVIAHELGHNFGLGHSSARQCNGAVEAGTCRTVAYRDYYDVMGVSWSQVGSLAAPQAARLGLLPAAQRQAVSASGAGGTYTLAPMAGRTGVRALQLTDSNGAVYWLEYRTAAGRDAYLGTPATNPAGLQTGVLLRRAAGQPDTSLLLDGTPGASGGWDADMQTALPVGTAVPVSGGDFAVTVQSTSASGATVRVTTPSSRAQANRSPVGALDAISVTPSALTVSGWAVDPDTPATVLAVHVYVDGRGVPIAAGGQRPESDAVPEAGDLHGFSFSTAVGAGEHRVCVYAIDSAPGAGSTTLGCRTLTSRSLPPTGALEQFGVAGTTLTVTGWAFDPDAQDARVQVHVYVDGRGVPMIASGTSASATALAARYGFNWSTSLSAGRHDACVYAIDSTAGAPNTVLGCQTFTVQASPPVGALESLAVSGSDVTVSGWAFDPDAPSSPIQVHVYVDAYGVPVLAGDAPPADYPAEVGSHAFTATVRAPQGSHQVCVYAIDGALGPGNTQLGCRHVVVG